MIIIHILLLILPVLLSVALMTLAERTVMASMQRRYGPQISGISGLLQPFYDGIKLGVKETILPDAASVGAFAASPMISFVLSQVAWVGILISDSSYQGLVLMAISSLAVYGVMLAGWASNSRYAFLGCLRSVALMVSYELSLGAALLSIGLFATDSNGVKSLNFCEMPSTPNYAMLPLCLIFLVCILAETKRVPFDLPEAEAELVAGYNVEYSSLGFALFFIAEYASMAVMSAIASVYFLGGFSALKITVLFFSFVWVRGTLPRYRYDQFMRLGWKAFLPLSLAFFALHASIAILNLDLTGTSYLCCSLFLCLLVVLCSLDHPATLFGSSICDVFHASPALLMAASNDSSGNDSGSGSDAEDALNPNLSTMSKIDPAASGQQLASLRMALKLVEEIKPKDPEMVTKLNNAMRVIQPLMSGPTKLSLDPAVKAFSDDSLSFMLKYALSQAESLTEAQCKGLGTLYETTLSAALTHFPVKDLFKPGVFALVEPASMAAVIDYSETNVSTRIAEYADIPLFANGLLQILVTEPVAVVHSMTGIEHFCCYVVVNGTKKLVHATTLVKCLEAAVAEISATYPCKSLFSTLPR